MKCQECRGACCETFELPMIDIRPPSEDAMAWIMLHGRAITEDPIRLRFACRCTALTDAGACGIYNDRPHVCQDMPVGGAECLGYVRDSRTPDEYTRIRDDDDPPTIHKGDH